MGATQDEVRLLQYCLQAVTDMTARLDTVTVGLPQTGVINFGPTAQVKMLNGTGLAGDSWQVIVDSASRLELAANTLRVPSSSTIFVTNRMALSGSSQGVLWLGNSSQSDTDLFLALGLNTVAAVGLKRVGTGLQVRLGNDSAPASVTSLYERFGTGSPEGVVAAPVGAIYHRTDGGTGISNYFKETGAATSTGWVAK